MKDVGLVGLPFSGKSTLFTALTRAGGAGGRSNQAVVPVPDPRLPVLAKLERSRRVVPAHLRFVDIPGGITAKGLATMRETDALCLVLRSFGADADPSQQFVELRAELLLADLEVVDSTLQNARRRLRGGRSSGQDVAALERAHAALSDERPLLDARLEEEELKHIRGLAPLTLKPWVLVANLEEGASVPPGLPEDTVGVWASIEAETVGMPDEEARALLSEFGVSEPSLDRVIAACYKALDLITFFTTANEETRAWQVRNGTTAQQAAGLIHTDMSRGFIRVEVVSHDDLSAEGGWQQARARGLVRLEGREYVVREGDILHVRFNV
jgi:ribosome-binding ATPase